MVIKRILLFIFAAFLFTAAARAGGGNLSGTGRAQLLNDRSRQIIGADLVSAPGFVTPAGLTGRGQVVAVADSGIDKGSIEDIHPDLAGQPGKKPKIIMLRSWAGRQAADDPVGHGTHMAGTIAGNGSASGGKFRGVAPEANIYFQGILDPAGKIAPPAEVDKLFLPAYLAGARIHVNAWGSGGNTYSESARDADAFIRNYPDFLVIFGAGNSGPGTKTLTAEANSKNALVVGASVSPRPALDFLAGETRDPAQFSSRGPAGDGRIKPDLLAPGTSIISTRSSLVKGNLPGFTLYTRMQGSSMASAVAGGAAALMREYLQAGKGIGDPSSALVKALLINGARTGDAGPSAEGFGVLDIGGTVLALKENSMRFLDHRSGIKKGESFEYAFEVAGSGEPLKVTLAWNDPPGQPGEDPVLVNNLDLEVRGPGGETYRGNHFVNSGAPDSGNNVEQVFIRNPAPGRYTIKVRAADVRRPVVNGSCQDFALVYGQPLPGGIVREINGISGTLVTAEGRRLDLAGKNIKIAFDGGGASPGGKEIPPGFRVYAGSDSLYAAGLIWNPQGVRAMQTSRGILWTDVDSGRSGGGYYQAEQGRIIINGSQGGSIDELPPGVYPVSTVDPVTQKIWESRINYRVREGIIYSLDGAGKNTLRFVGDGSPYRISDSAIYMNSYDFYGTDPFVSAFGPYDMKKLGTLQPGMRVKAIIDPLTREIRSVIANWQVVAGAVAGVDKGKREVVLDNSNTYRLLEGANIFRDDRPADIEDLRAGDSVSAVLLPRTGTLIGLVAYSGVAYGQIIYFSESDKTIYFNGIQNRFKLYGLEEDLAVYRRGNPGSPSDLSSGAWARMVINPDSGKIKYVYIAEWIDQLAGTIHEITGSTVTFTDGSKYLLSRMSTCLKDESPVTPADFLPGEEVLYSPLLGADGKNVIAYMKGRPGGGGEKPELKYIAMPLNQYYLISGVTGGDRVYVWRGSGARVDIVPNSRGEFTHTFVPASGDETVWLVAVNRAKGTVDGRLIYVPPQVEKKFNDIWGHWAEQPVTKLAGRGIVAGYTDYSFRPDTPITREELAVLVANALGWRDGDAVLRKYRDRNTISSWAEGGAGALTARGVLTGFSDGTFRPGNCVTRSELAVVLEKVSTMTAKINRSPGLPVIGDWDSVPVWARDPVERVYMAGILKGKPGEIFAPLDYASRAEAAVALYRFIELMEKG